MSGDTVAEYADKINALRKKGATGILELASTCREAEAVLNVAQQEALFEMLLMPKEHFRALAKFGCGIPETN